MKNFVRKVNDLLRKRGISQKQLARVSEISESSISRYLSGAIEPRMDIVINIAKALNVPVSYFLEEELVNKNFKTSEDVIAIVTRNREKLTNDQKTQIIKILFGE